MSSWLVPAFVRCLVLLPGFGPLRVAGQPAPTATPLPVVGTGSPVPCPVTLAYGGSPLEEEAVPSNHGNGELRIELWLDGTSRERPANVRPDGALAIKLPWCRGSWSLLGSGSMLPPRRCGQSWESLVAVCRWNCGLRPPRLPPWQRSSSGDWSVRDEAFRWCS